jgi:hypothetical protein
MYKEMTDSLVGVWCFFTKDEMSPLDDPHNSGNTPLRTIERSGPEVPYLAQGEIEGVQVKTVQFYYYDNPATGIGWQEFPKSPDLGYHIDDIEWVAIFADGHVAFSRHGKNEVVPIAQCNVQDNYLCVYVARNSHACYPRSAQYSRLNGLAIDSCAADGSNKKYPFTSMKQAYDWDNGHGIHLYASTRPGMTETSTASSTVGEDGGRLVAYRNSVRRRRWRCR